MFDRIIEELSPKWAFERRAYRAGLAEMEAMQGERAYAAASRGRKSADWRATNGSANQELITDLPTLRARHSQMIRDNPYVKSAHRNLVANIVGTGIEARATHPDPKVQAEAQAIFTASALEPMDVEGTEDFYGQQKLAVSAMIERGDALTVWRPEGREPDRLVEQMEGDQIDGSQNRRLQDGGRVIAGVQFDVRGRREGFHVLDHHPGDQIAWLGTTSHFIPARDVDHIFERVRIGQARGVPWFHAGLQTVRNVSDTEESIRIRKRVEACLTVFRKAGEGTTPSRLGVTTNQPDGPAWERLVPGMVVNGKPGESLDIINPSSSGDGDGFLRTQLMAAAASFGLPTHIMTGDVSQSSYSSLRASMVVFWSLLDDWVFNTVVPRQCNPMFRRIMRREAVRRGNAKLLEARAEWTPPKRSWVDPLKDIMADVMESRSFPGGLNQAMAARGRDLRQALVEQSDINALIDQLGLALDSDPRRVNGSGGLQPAAGYLRPTGE